MPDSGRPMFGLSVLKSDPGPVGLASVEAEMAKLELIRDLALPQGLWGGDLPPGPGSLPRQGGGRVRPGLASPCPEGALDTAGGILLAAAPGDRRRAGGPPHPDRSPHRGASRAAGRCRSDRGDPQGRGQDRAALSHRRSCPGEPRPHHARGPFSPGRRGDLRRAGPGEQYIGSDLPPAHPDPDPSLLCPPLPAHAAADPGRPDLSLQQQPASAGDRGLGVAAHPTGRPPSVDPLRRNSPSPVWSDPSCRSS